MSRYVILVKVGKNNASDSLETGVMTFSYETKILESFEEAKKEMRKTVAKMVKKCRFIPMEGFEYMPINEFVDDIIDTYQNEIKDEAIEYWDSFKELINKTITDPSYQPDLESYKKSYFCHCDYGDGYFAFIAKTELLRVYYYGKELSTNIHNMNDKNKDYFFSFLEDDYDLDHFNMLSITLTKAD